MKVFIGADHRGFELKNKLVVWLNSNNYQSEDCGAHEYESTDDYPDFAKAVGEKVSSSEGSRGIVICGGGSGVVIVANKINGIRSALALNSKQVEAGRADDDINVLGLASDFVSEQEAIELAETFLKTKYDPSERHQRRIDKIKRLEE